jgi:Flp pilus assembly protein TadG
VRARLHGERGQEMAVEVMVLLPVALFLVVLVVWTGRYTTSRSRLSDVAAAAARAATLENDEATGRAAARRTIAEATELPAECNSVTALVAVVGPRGHPGSWRGARVTVSIDCTVRNTALAGVWAPGAAVLHGRATHPVDPFRAP